MCRKKSQHLECQISTIRFIIIWYTFGIVGIANFLISLVKFDEF
jgi:hypothetical protein